MPSGPTTTAAAASSCVEKMLQLAQRTCAPSATSVSISTAVCTVMCSEPATRAPVRGLRLGVPLAQRHQPGHLLLGEADLVPTRLPRGRDRRPGTRGSDCGAPNRGTCPEDSSEHHPRPEGPSPSARRVLRGSAVSGRHAGSGASGRGVSPRNCGSAEEMRIRETSGAVEGGGVGLVRPGRRCAAPTSPAARTAGPRGTRRGRSCAAPATAESGPSTAIESAYT